MVLVYSSLMPILGTLQTKVYEHWGLLARGALLCGSRAHTVGATGQCAVGSLVH